ncbi:hypothetical protein IWX90DRAFT_505856 [Phyllosticta citrichinensis]|uniref:Uncharacterized protein n=1 Tax=Phyllosticta citrichinensis TaxID=1130410 RepID=A0ABR1XM84_9PEZI
MNIISSLPRCQFIHRMLAHSIHKAYVACDKEPLLLTVLGTVFDRRERSGITVLMCDVRSAESGHARRETTIQDNAILMGLSVAGISNIERIRKEKELGVKEPSVSRSWKACRMSRALAHSPWRCAAHQQPSQSNERLRAESSAVSCDCFDMKTLVKVCGEYSRHCDGSTMTFENREAGFRYTIRPDDTLDAERESKQRGYGGSTEDAEEYPFENPYRDTEDNGSSSDES